MAKYFEDRFERKTSRSINEPIQSFIETKSKEYIINKFFLSLANFPNFQNYIVSIVPQTSIVEKNFVNRGLSDLSADISISRMVKSWKGDRFRFSSKWVQPNRSLIFQRDILHDNGSPVYRYPRREFSRRQNRVVASVAASFHGTLSVVERNMRATAPSPPPPRKTITKKPPRVATLPSSKKQFETKEGGNVWRE